MRPDTPSLLLTARCLITVTGRHHRGQGRSALPPRGPTSRRAQPADTPGAAHGWLAAGGIQSPACGTNGGVPRPIPPPAAKRVGPPPPAPHRGRGGVWRWGKGNTPKEGDPPQT